MSQQLTDLVQFKNGSTITNRMAVAPMLTFSGLEEGLVSEDTKKYYSARSQAAGLIIAEYMYVQRDGGPCIPIDFPEQLALYGEEHIEGVKEVVESLQRHGNKVILQIHHGGREAIGRHQKGETVYSPSKIDFEFLDYSVEEMSDEYIRELIKNFGIATQRALDLGADGVEIHGANHYLIQQFFSKYSNRRTDFWGGSLEKRMNFPLEVTKEVQRVVAENNPNEFIVGYRLSPEEVHGENYGYDYKDAIKLVQAVAEHNVDYIHLSLWEGYNSTPNQVEKSYSELFKNALNEDIMLISTGGVFTEKQAQEAIIHTDIVGIGRGTLIDPEFGLKIVEGRGDEIVSEISEEQLEKSQLTPGLVEVFSDNRNFFGLPLLPGYESITHLHENWLKLTDEHKGSLER